MNTAFFWCSVEAACCFIWEMCVCACMCVILNMCTTLPLQATHTSVNRKQLWLAANIYNAYRQQEVTIYTNNEVNKSSISDKMYLLLMHCQVFHDVWVTPSMHKIGWCKSNRLICTYLCLCVCYVCLWKYLQASTLCNTSINAESLIAQYTLGPAKGLISR